MKKLIKRLMRIAGIPFVLADYFKFKKALCQESDRFPMSIKDFYPRFIDKTISTGFDRHYVYHTSWAARKVKEINPSLHIDIGSGLHFSGILSAFIPVDFYDYRPAALLLPGLRSLEGNLHSLPFENNSVASLSCMHTIEHIGLGRYGDPIDPDGDIKAARELARVLKPGGSLLFVTPIGRRSLIEWNAHRIYTYEDALALFGGLELKEFSFIHEHEKDGGIVFNADPALSRTEHYGCGCFWFVKK